MEDKSIGSIFKITFFLTCINAAEDIYFLLRRLAVEIICFYKDKHLGSYLKLLLAALYDDRSVRAHVHRTRELLSLSTLHSSLSTTLALQHETGQNTSGNLGGL